MQIELFYLRCHLKWLSKEGQVLPSSKDSTPLSFFKFRLIQTPIEHFTCFCQQ